MSSRSSAWAPVVDDSRRRPLTAAERERYARNVLVPEVGMAGQERIRAARVLLVGAGALGSPAALYLAAAGVGTLGIIDPDVVEVSNLQRQVLHTTGAAGRAKTDSARAALAALNPDVELVTVPERVTSANALTLLEGWDVVVDGTDNFPTRYLLGDATVLLGVPLVHGSVLRSHGQVSVFDAAHGPCYRCLHPEPPPPGSVPSCAEAGVLGVLPGIIGSMQATEALKLVVGGARPLIGRLLVLDAWGARVDELTVARNPDCPVCGRRPSITRASGLIDYETWCALPQAPDDGQDGERAVSQVSAAWLRERIEAGRAPAVLDVREQVEVELRAFAGARHIPLGEVVERLGELDPTRPTVVLCAAGVRSLRAIEALREAGYPGELINLEGGLRAWDALG